MPRGCVISGCNNRPDNKEKWVVLPHVTKLSFHSCIDPNHLRTWSQLIHGGGVKRKGVSTPLRVCSNHFPQGQPLLSSPFPTMYLRGYGEVGDHQTVSDHSAVSAAKELDHAYTDFKTCHKKRSRREVTEGERTKSFDESLPSPISCCPADIVYCHGKQDSGRISLSSKRKTAVTCDVPVNDHTCLSNLSGSKGAPADSVSHHLREKSVKSKPGRRTRAKKRNNRNTDHIYNTRKAKPVEETFPKKVNNRDTDHLYNLRKTETKEDYVGKTQNNRDTDHMYNMRKTDISGCVAGKGDCVSANKKELNDIAVVDKRVVDKDHMYQHSVRKRRNKSDKSTEAKQEPQPPYLAAKKRKLLAANEPSHAQEHSLPKGLSADAENMVPPCKILRENRTRTCPSEPARNTKQETSKPRVCSVMDFHTVTDSMLEPDHLDVQDSIEAVTCASPSTSTVPSPVHSDNDSDHICEDDSRTSGVWHTDHLYVHADYLDNGILAAKVQPVLTPCISAEGYKQEHSYANSEEHHYDACVNCSELVQQLIGTIRQQGDQIDDMKKKLRAANAKIKQLSLVPSHQAEDLE